MEIYTRDHTRRQFLRVLATGAASMLAFRLFPEEAAAYIASGDYAQDLVRTPAQTEGPFYPDKLPLDTDNDLVLIDGRNAPSKGTVTQLSGRVLDIRGEPIKDAMVEIWQVDANGVYLHRDSSGRDKYDSNFQGYGRFLTDSSGRYTFRTIKPVPYPGRTPHIHYKVTRKERHLLTTQLYIEGEPSNERDGILRGIRDEKARKSVIVPFKKIEASRAGELQAIFDIVLGSTPTA